MTFKEKSDAYRQMTEAYLETRFTDAAAPQQILFQAMRYSLLAGGKRIRPMLVLEFCRLCGGDVQKALPFAAALEMVHTYSLIHDDLPCMDNDDYRRGRLTNHKVFGDAVATLAGDALLTAAFSEVSSADAPADRICTIVKELSVSAGELGMVGGQVLDMEGEKRRLSPEEVEQIHLRKTGCLISAACKIGVLSAGGTESQLDAAAAYAKSIGLAFQIRDDMLDVLGNAERLGKAVNADEKKTTFVTLYGIDTCAKLIDKQTKTAIQALSAFPDTSFLSELAQKMAIREY